jgi:uncharacterized protein (DUF488 family)
MGEEKRIFTMGTSDRTIEKMIHLLRLHQIAMVVDVRSWPKSKFPQFNQETLAASLKEAGLGYAHLGRELGGFRKGGYEAYTPTDNYRKGLARLEQAANRCPSVILCAERSPARCHRRFIVQSLEERGWQVVHL